MSSSSEIEIETHLMIVLICDEKKYYVSIAVSRFERFAFRQFQEKLFR